MHDGIRLPPLGQTEVKKEESFSYISENSNSVESQLDGVTDPEKKAQIQEEIRLQIQNEL